MKLIVGLGNPGSQYAHTRHNLGFMVVDSLANTLGAKWKEEIKLKAFVAEVPEQKLLLAKPTTFMNLSGEAVQRLMQAHRLTPADTLVVFDDLDVPFGRLRIRQGGTSGGHQGVSSIIRHIGENFLRVRAGISLNDRTQEPSEVYVLKPFDQSEQEKLPIVLTAAAAIVLEVAQSGASPEATFNLG